MSFGRRFGKANDAPNKLVSTVCDDIDDGIRPLYSKKVAASFDEKKIKYEDDDCLGRSNAENFWVKTRLQTRL